LKKFPQKTFLNKKNVQKKKLKNSFFSLFKNLFKIFEQKNYSFFEKLFQNSAKKVFSNFKKLF